MNLIVNITFSKIVSELIKKKKEKVLHHLIETGMKNTEVYHNRYRKLYSSFC